MELKGGRPKGVETHQYSSYTLTHLNITMSNTEQLLNSALAMPAILEDRDAYGVWLLDFINLAVSGSDVPTLLTNSPPRNPTNPALRKRARAVRK